MINLEPQRPYCEREGIALPVGPHESSAEVLLHREYDLTGI